ncbi:MAG: DUF4832 domain-containing protein [Lachnospiraceae bacterium]|nr:DUF4832 domain-containing protein [Lachnospiraceae bacterium]
MKKTFNVAITVVLALVMMAAPCSVFAEQSLDDSGIDYSDALEKTSRNDYLTSANAYDSMDALYMNPGRGFYWWPGTLTLRNSSGNNPINPKSEKSSLIYLPVNLYDFSGAYHPDATGGRGEDNELTQSALDALDKTLKNIRNNNNQVILRFIYDKSNDGVQADEGILDPATNRRIIEPEQSMILRHIEQLGPVLNENAQAIYTVQIGFYGSWGELHSSAMCTKENIKGALEKLLEATRTSDLRISVRTPQRYADYLGINIGDIENAISSPGEDAYRVAVFNDGYLGNATDWGTFTDRAREINWLSTQDLHNPYGGEAILDQYGRPSDVAKEPNVLAEMFKTHTSYISHTWNQALHTYWASQTYSGTGDEFEGTNLFQYIEYHLGYRFVLRDSRLYKQIESGDTMPVNYKIENVGFGNLLYPVGSCVYITDKDGNVILQNDDIGIDPRDYTTQEIVDSTLSIALPGDLPLGEYSIYIQFKIGDRIVNGETKPYGAIRFANEATWNSSLEANLLGTFSVIDHEWGEWEKTKDPTCSAAGEEQRVCKINSSHTETRETAIDEDAHDFGEWVVTKPATQSEEGTETRTCKNDPDHTETRTIPKLPDPQPEDDPGDTDPADDGSESTDQLRDALEDTSRETEDDPGSNRDAGPVHTNIEDAGQTLEKGSDVIVSNGTENDPPPTGDTSGSLIWGAVLLASLLALAGAMRSFASY